MNNNIYDLKLHEKTRTAPAGNGLYFIVVRVPGGWIYSESTEEGGSVFVPFNIEFQER